MSNDRHLTIDDGTMGSLFRRVTLATLGLDSLDDVSEQSFEVIDRADSFAERLLGGVSNVMPKFDIERLGTQSSSFAEHLCSGISGLNGPKNATDLGDWQYWLDAALLMLFDEDDEEAESVSSTQTASMTQVKSSKAVNAAAVRSRVAALKKSGVTPEMLHSLPQSAKKAVIAEMKSVQNSNEQTIGHADFSAVVAEKLSASLKNAMAVSGIKAESSSIGRVFAENSRQAYASHIAEKAAMVSSELSLNNNNTEVATLTQRWSQSIQKISSKAQNDMSAVREMLGALDSLERLGAVSKEQANGLRSAGSSYARHVLMSEISNDATALASRMQNMLVTRGSDSKSPLISSRAMTVSAPHADAENASAFRHVFAALNEKLSDFSTAVSARVLTDGESAATLRWNRAADRFMRLQGVSDDIDRVLLRDVEESAAALGDAGIVSKSLMESIKAAAKRGSEENAYASKDSMNEVLAHFGTSRVLGSLVSRIETSVDSLVREISRTGMAGSGVESFVSDIRQMLSTGSSNSGISGSAQVSSVIESICSRLDEFAEMAAADVVSNGYDALTSEAAGAFVSMADEKSESGDAQGISSARGSKVGLNHVQQIQQALVQAKEQAHEQLKSFISQYKSSAEQSQLVADIINASTAESLISAQKALAPHLDSAASAELSRMVAAVQRSQSHLESVAKQVKLIESTLKVSNSLRSSVKSDSNSIGMDNLRINGNYLNALGGTLKAYAKIRSDYSVSGNQFVAGMTEGRLERMLSTVKPETGSAETAKEAMPFAGTSSSEVVLGYDDVVPESMEWIRQNAHYPSTNEAGSLNAILGSRKAAEIHAQDLASGRASSVQALADSLARAASHKNGITEVTSYTVTDSGERVKVSVAVSPSQANAHGFNLRQSIGETYMPNGVSSETAKGINARLSMSKLDASSAVSGVDEFVPVGLGANRAEKALDDKQGDKNVAQMLLGRFGISSAASVAADGMSDKFRMNVHGVDFEMSAGDFVHMVAKPSMESVAVSMPSMMGANNSLFAGYASMLANSSESRSLKSLRNAYVESLARTGESGAHSEIGFNTQSFTNVMGLARKPQMTVRHETDKQFDIVPNHESTVSPEMADSADFTWVSNQLSPDVSTSSYQQPAEQPSNANAHELLGRIDSMLDYVENLSERNVGVFSTDDTVRVLLEALPAEGQLGNKGLPKWRQKDTRAARAIEAKELRDALAKIGATPVQGVQRFANKQYVSPNLLQDQASGAAPLFSDGESMSTTPGASANASKSGNNQFVSSSIKDEDLQFIAEEVFHKIEESLNEEHQRRRSE